MRSIQPGERSLRLRLNLHLLHIRLSYSELQDTVPVVFGEVVFIHQLDDICHSFFAIVLQSLDQQLEQ